MKKLLRIFGIISSLILSMFGLTACDEPVQEMYGVLPSDPIYDSTIYETENDNIEENNEDYMMSENN